MAPTRGQIVAIFARERDRVRIAPHGHVIGHIPESSVQVNAGLTGLGAGLGFVLAAVVTPVFAWLVGRIAGEPAPRALLLGAVAGVAGACLGALVVRRGARSFAREINAHVERGRLVTLLDGERADAEDYCRQLESQGALEALTLPRGLTVSTAAEPRALIPFPRFKGDFQEDVGFGATFLAGHGDLLAAAARLEDEGVRIAFVGRDGHAGPVHSSTAGPGWVHAPAPEGGEGWWRDLTVRHGRPIRIALADGELVLLGDARRLALVLAGHRNDAIGSALARLAELFGCPDASARVVTDRIDEGGVGLVVFGPLDARRRAVERLAAVAIASSEGASAHAAERGVA